MTIYIDSANLEHIEEIHSWGVCGGCTTNQKIILNSGLSTADYKKAIKRIAKLFPDHVSIELTQTDKDNSTLIDEALELRKISKAIVIKVPMWSDGRGLRITNELVIRDIPVNLTCLMGYDQAILAVESGAKYISLFYNRMADYHASRRYAQDQIARARAYIEDNYYDTKIIAGSIRDPKDVSECLVAGAHIVTVQYKHLKLLPHHIKTEATISEFDDAWKQFKGKSES